MNLKNVIIPEGLIHDRTERLAWDIINDLVTRKLLNLQLLIHMMDRSVSMADFLRLKSYSNNQSTGKTQVIGSDNLDNLKRKNVVIVEDMVDAGNAMAHLLDLMKKYDIESIQFASLLA